MTEAAEPSAEDEAARAAMEELGRLDRATHFTPEPAAPQAPGPERRYLAPQPQPPRAYTAPAGAQQPFWQQKPEAPRKATTIEELCSAHPQLGNGEVFLRVERREPKSFAGRSVSGFLGDVHGPMTMSEFADTYGGQKYDLSIIGPGPSGPRKLATLEGVTVPGPPAMGSLPHEEDRMQRVPAYPPQPGYGGEPAAVALKRMDLDAARAEREAEERRSAMRPPTEMFSQLDGANQRSVEAIKEAQREANEVLRQQNAGLAEELRGKKAEVDALQARVATLVQDLANARHAAETDAVTRLRSSQENELRRIAEEHAKVVERLTTEHRSALDAETRRHTEERTRLEGEHSRERDRIRDDANRREESLKSDHAREMTHLRETQRDRIEDLERRTQAQLTDMRMAQERELASIKASEQAQATVSTRLADFQTAASREELENLRKRNRELEKECDALRRASIKEPGAYIQETKTFAREVLGMKDRDEVDEAPAEGEVDWKKSLMALAGKAIEQGPQFLEKLGGVRAQNMAAQEAQRAHVAAVVAAQQRAAGQGGQPIQMPPGMAGQAPQQQPRRRAPMAPPPAWSVAPGPPAPGMAPPGPIASTGPFVAPPTFQSGAVVAFQPPQGPAQAPVTDQEVRDGASPLQPEQAQAAPVPADDVAAAQASVVQFVDSLNSAIAGDAVPPELFAAGVIEQIGPERARQFVGQMSPDTLFAMVEQSGAPALQLMTRKGQQYVRAMWVAAETQLRARGV